MHLSSVATSLARPLGMGITKKHGRGYVIKIDSKRLLGSAMLACLPEIVIPKVAQSDHITWYWLRASWLSVVSAINGGQGGD